MSGKRGKPKYKAFIISLLISTAILITGLWFMDGMTFELVARKLFFPLSRLMFFITLGLVAGQVIEASGWTHALAVVARPFFRFGNLGDRCSAAFTAAFVSGVTSNAMLLDFYKDNKITKRQMFLSNFVNQFPAYFLHLPTTFFIVIPLTGLAGIYYFALTFSATVLRTALFLIFGHFVLDPEEGEIKDRTPESKKKKLGIIEGVKKKLLARVINIAVFVLPVYIAVFVVNYLGFFKMANTFISSHIVVGFIPVESLSVVILSFAAEFTSGFAAAGALMNAGVITVKQTVLALIVGNILAFPIRALRHQLPRYIGIFSPKMGSQLLIMGQLFRVGSLVVVTLIFYAFF